MVTLNGGKAMQITGSAYSALYTSLSQQPPDKNGNGSQIPEDAATDYSDLADYGSTGNTIFQNLLKDPSVQSAVVLGSDGTYSIDQNSISATSNGHLAVASLLINAQNSSGLSNPSSPTSYSTKELSMFRQTTGYNLIQSGDLYAVVDDNGNPPAAGDAAAVNAAWNAFDVAKGVEGLEGETGDLTVGDIKDALEGQASQVGANKAMYDDLMKMIEGTSTDKEQTA